MTTSRKELMLEAQLTFANHTILVEVIVQLRHEQTNVIETRDEVFLELDLQNHFDVLFSSQPNSIGVIGGTIDELILFMRVDQCFCVLVKINEHQLLV